MSMLMLFAIMFILMLLGPDFDTCKLILDIYPLKPL